MTLPFGRPHCLVHASLLILATFLVGPSARAEKPSTERGSKFLRFVDDGRGGGRLESSIVRFRNADGVTVDLIGAVHIGEKSYFAALSDRFDQYDALLYEMVKPVNAPVPGERPATRPARGGRPRPMLRAVGGLQQFMKETLRLSFQLEEINYARANFVHADLDAETFARLQDERGESMVVLLIRAMIEGARNPALARNQPTLPELLAALAAPDRDRQLKLLLARQLADLDAMSGLLEGNDGSVILTERNRRAVEVFDREVANGKRRLGIFYGAAHLDGIEKMLRDRGFAQAGEPEWLVAWNMAAK